MINCYFRADIERHLRDRPGVLYFVSNDKARGVLQPLDAAGRWLCQINVKPEEWSLDFFDKQGITIESLHSSRYRAMQTGAEMFTAQVTVGIPSNMHIAALRDDFLEFCDHLNLDAIMDPMKF